MLDGGGKGWALKGEEDVDYLVGKAESRSGVIFNFFLWALWGRESRGKWRC